MSLKPIRSVRWTAAFLLLGPLPLAAQQLDDSLLDQAEERPARQWDWNAGEAGIWNVWLELDAGTIEQFDNRTTNNIRQVATLGHAEWSDNTLTMAMNRIDNSGFSNVVDNQGRYVPNAVRVGAAHQVWKGLSAGIQLGRAWSPAYVNCVRADGEAVVASWNQVRFADLVDQYLYYDDLYDGDQWRYENDGVFGEGITGWRAEIVLQQELAHGLGWTASLGTTVGLNRELESRTAALFGSQGLLPEDELGPTLTPTSIAAAPSSASLGATYRSGPAVVGLSWSSVFISGSDRNDWVILGAEAIAPMNQMRLRLGMTF